MAQKEISIFYYPWYVLKRKAPHIVFVSGLGAGIAFTAMGASLLTSIMENASGRAYSAAAPAAIEASIHPSMMQMGERLEHRHGKRSQPKTVTKQDAYALPAKQDALTDDNIQPEEGSYPSMAIIPPPPVPKPEPDVIKARLSIQKGGKIEELLTAHRVSEEDATAIVRAMQKYFNMRELRAGQALSVSLNSLQDDGTRPVDDMRLHLSPTKEIIVTPELNGDESITYKAKQVEVPLVDEPIFRTARIRSSFLQAGSDAGISNARMYELMKAFSYDIDFQRDLHLGDQLTVLMTRKKNAEGEIVSTGSVEYAKLERKGITHELFHYNGAYYHADGRSVRKGLMRTPVDGARISSSYGMRRHPILGYSKMHRGIDFAAPRGTPVYAAGDGTITHAGPKGSYGNYISISHSSAYSTAYAHLHRIHHKIHHGSRVKQGELIGYVGSTGRSTGPHLHYEIMVNGQQVNPQGVKFAPQQKLAGQDYANFTKHKKQIELTIASLKAPTRQRMASLDIANEAQ